MAPRSKATAAKRLELAELAASAVVAPTDDPTLDAIITAIGPFTKDVINTLGEAAKLGDVPAAKILLEFLGRALTGRTDKKGQDILRQIAEIRRTSDA